MTTHSDLYGYTDSNSQPIQLAIPNLNYAKDFAVVSNSGNSAVLVNKTTPVNQKESVRISIQDVANVYANTDVDPTLFAPTKRGKSVVCQIADTAIVTHTDGSKVAYPVSAHVVCKFPLTDDISSENVFEVMKRAFALCFDTTDAAASANNSYYEYDAEAETPGFVNKGNAKVIYKEEARMNEIFRGAVNPIQ